MNAERRQRVLVVLGTRPEAIKLAPVIRALQTRAAQCDLTVCATGQHREMLAQALGSFGLRADLDLALMQPGQDAAEFVGRLLLALRPVLHEQRPDVVVVQGDTGTVLAAGLAGFFAGARVAHVEAGLRTRDKRAPFPEEVNRRVAGVVADVHFAATFAARDNLLAEGVPPAAIHVTGNTVIDALLWMRALVADQPLPAGIRLGDRRLVLVTAHRRESFGAPFRDLCGALRDIADQFDDVQLVYPVHLNPNVQAPVQELLADHPRITLIPPQDYAAFVALLARADLVLTDSGGVQEEAPALGKPVLVLRDKTERPEAVAAGAVQLVGTDRHRIVSAAAAVLRESSSGVARPSLHVYGDGRAAERITEILLDGYRSTPPFGA